MGDAGASAGEQCGWCRNPMNVGALACAACGARRENKKQGGFWVLAVLMLNGWLFVIPGLLLGLFGYPGGFLGRNGFWPYFTVGVLWIALTIVFARRAPIRVIYTRK